MDNKTTSDEIATIASKAVQGKKLTVKEIKSLGASALAQTRSDDDELRMNARKSLSQHESDLSRLITNWRQSEDFPLQMNRRHLAIATTQIEMGFMTLYKAIDESVVLEDESQS